jgi:hypothetical protein
MQLFLNTLFIWFTAVRAAPKPNLSRRLQNPFVPCGDIFCYTPRGECVEQTPGGGQEICRCFDGNRGDSCLEDVDECSEVYPCKGPANASFCVNLPAPEKYRCGCLDGWNAVLPENVVDPVPLDWRPLDCIDVDECTESDLNPCPDNLTCVNSPGSYDCIPAASPPPTTSSSTTSSPAPAPLVPPESGDDDDDDHAGKKSKKRISKKSGKLRKSGKNRRYA